MSRSRRIARATAADRSLRHIMIYTVEQEIRNRVDSPFAGSARHMVTLALNNIRNSRLRNDTSDPQLKRLIRSMIGVCRRQRSRMKPLP